MSSLETLQLHKDRKCADRNPLLTIIATEPPRRKIDPGSFSLESLVDFGFQLHKPKTTSSKAIYTLNLDPS